MFCKNCGKNLQDNVSFCDGCGKPVSQKQNQINTASQAAIPEQRVYAPRKKRRIGCLISIIVVIVVIGTAFWFVASFLGILGPKNLSVSYTDADYVSAMEKIGTQIVFEDKTAEEWRELAESNAVSDEKYPIADYEFVFSDFERKEFEFTSAEATAFLNEIAPPFWWFEDQQVNVLEDGKIEASGTLFLKKALEDLYPDMTDELPIPIFDKVNLYASGYIKIKNNELTLDADNFLAGPIKTVSAEMLNENAFYFEKLYECIPELEIYSLEVTKDGKIEVDALIPQKVEVYKRNDS